MFHVEQLQRKEAMTNVAIEKKNQALCKRFGRYSIWNIRANDYNITSSNTSNEIQYNIRGE